MLSDLIRARLGALGRELAHTIGPQPRMRSAAASAPPSPQKVPPQCERWQQLGREVANRAGLHWQVCHDLDTLWPQAPAAISRCREAGEHGGRHPEDFDLAPLAKHFPARTLFLDLETCGFAGSPIFLAGIVRATGAGLVVEQLLARNYAEEPAVLESLWQAVASNQVLVTFNGKSFDWPMVRDRTARHRMPQGSSGPPVAGSADRGRGDLVHCDLLHAARRRWKAHLPNCRLQTLEKYVCRRHRLGDLPGAAVPAAYHDFVRSGDGAQIGAILHHNALDLATLVELAARLLAE